MDRLKKMLDAAGIYQCGTVDTDKIRFTQEVRAMCEVNTCRQYGKTWACPPAIGTVEECRERVQKYEKMLVFSIKYDLEDSFDYEGMLAGMKHFKKCCRAFDDAVRPYIKEYFIVSNEGCDLCTKCTYPDAPCRFPERSHGSLEGYGIFVSELAKQAGINYINGPNTVTYFGALICHTKDLEQLMETEAEDDDKA